MKNYKSFDMLKEFNYVRMGGTKEELEAANYFLQKCKELNVEAKLEDFEIDFPVIKKAKFEVLEPEYKEYTVTGYGMTGQTPKDGIEKEFAYVENVLEANLIDVEDKIVLLNGRIGVKDYKALLEKKIAGFIALSGSFYDDYDKTDLEWNILRPAHYEKGKIPAVTMRARDGQELILSEPRKVRLTLLEDEGEATSHNVVATIPGSTKANEVIAFTAHYDSVRFSKGSFDNATGSTTIFELMAYFCENKPQRTLKFIWCGSEERGLLGSKAYVEAHKDELKDYKLCINVDMTGVVLGYDIACCTTEKSVASYINSLGLEEGFAIKARQGVYSSDSTPFADNNVPAISFARLSPTVGARIHSRLDVLEVLDSKNYYKTCEFIEKFAAKMDSSVIVPIPQTIPQEMKDELDYYNLRKERPSK